MSARPSTQATPGRRNNRAAAPHTDRTNIHRHRPARQPDWDQLAATDAFRALIRAKARFILPATAIFLTYYFALPLLVGYLPRLMDTRIIGVVNLAYLFALSQFVMAWVLAGIYLKRAARFDALARRIVEEADGLKGER